MAPDAPTNAEEMLELLVASKLLSLGAARELAARVPNDATESAKHIARWLIAEDQLTPYQARRLLRGEYRGLVVNQYEVKALLGRGGMGKVFLAFDRKLKRSCALKMLPAEGKRKARDRLRFQREMKVACRLQHPGIALAYEAGSSIGIEFLAMEYVPGPTLYRLVRRRGPIAAYWATRWLADVAGALDYVHQAGVFHRDLKPSNVIVTPEGEVKLLDLGLARWYDDDHNEELVVGRRRVVGSYDYMAPEQANNSARADARSDVYGLGCLLYFALAGRAPFQHITDVRKKLEHHQQVEPVPVERHAPGIPKELARAVRTMMAKKPDQRYQLAAEVRDTLLELSRQLRPVEPTAPPSLEETVSSLPAAKTEPIPVQASDPSSDTPDEQPPMRNGRAGLWSVLTGALRRLLPGSR